MKKKTKIFALIALVIGLGASSLFAAYRAGHCLKADCRCHQYIGDDGTEYGSGDCRKCGHSKAAHL